MEVNETLPSAMLLLRRVRVLTQTPQGPRLLTREKMNPGTSTIDWQQTLAARERFLNTQVPLVRR
jgi:hypothetical protein